LDALAQRNVVCANAYGFWEAKGMTSYCPISFACVNAYSFIKTGAIVGMCINKLWGRLINLEC
jgi:hypothetical protein